jgi:stage III sporulation protein AG
MGKNQHIFQKIKDWFFNSDQNSNEKIKKSHYILLLFIIGVAILLISNFFSKDPSSTSHSLSENTNTNTELNSEDVAVFKQKDVSDFNSIAEYEKYYEEQLKDVLENIMGVGDVSVVVNIDATEKKIFEKNKIIQNQTTEETDREGGQRIVHDQSTEEQMVIIRNGDKEVPLVSETKKPSVRGVLVVAKGAENIEVKKWIREAVTRYLDVPSHRVSVLAKKSKGE